MSKESQIAALKCRYNKLAMNGRNQGESGVMRKIKRKLRDIQKN